MQPLPIRADYGPPYTPQMVSAIATCSSAIGRLDARISVSSVARAWHRRSAWSGYTKGLLLQSAEIDEIDVFSWGCGLKIPGRPHHATNLDQFDRFEPWLAALANPDRLAWRDDLPTAVSEPDAAGEHPPLVRALDAVRQYARFSGDIDAWLALPFALRDARLSAIPLPCLVGGVKAFRLSKRIAASHWLAAIRDIEARTIANLDRLQALERLYRDGQRAIAAEYRPSALPALLALLQHRPLLSPRAVSDHLDLSVAGASKLLERARDLGLVAEITQRRTWRLFLTPDLATELGYISAKRGRPAREPPALPRDRDLAAVFDNFDSEMEKIDRLLGLRFAGEGDDAHEEN